MLLITREIQMANTALDVHPQNLEYYLAWNHWLKPKWRDSIWKIWARKEVEERCQS